LPERAALGNGHVHLRVTFHAAGNALVCLFLCFFDKVPAEKHPEEKDQQDDHERCADEFGQRELPAQERHDDDAELEDKIGGSHLERHRGREMRALAEERTGERHCRIGARRRGCAERESSRDRTRAIIRQKPCFLDTIQL